MIGSAGSPDWVRSLVVEQPTDLGQAEARIEQGADPADSLEMLGRVDGEASGTFGRRNQASGLVEADGVHAHACSVRQLRDSKFHVMTLRVKTLSV